MADKSNGMVSVIVVTQRAGDDLDRCLRSIQAQTYCPIEIIVIDNSLDANTGEAIRRRIPAAKVYVSPGDLSYCESLNTGIRMSAGDFILCLNDDVTLREQFVGEALQGFLRDEKVGMVSGKILRSDGKTIDSTGLFLSLWRTAKERGYGRKDAGKFEKEELIFGTNGAVAFYRKNMLEEIKEDGNYFDPDFRFFYEDLDIAWRAQRSGWEALYMPRAVATHVRGATVRSCGGIDKSYARRYLNDRLHADLIKNRYLVIIRNESVLSFLLHLPAIVFYDCLMWFYCLWFRPRAIRDFILDLPYLGRAMKKRRLKGKR